MGRFYQKTDANGSGNTNPNEAVGTAASESTVSGAEVKESTGMFPVMDALSPGFPVPDSIRHFSLKRFLIGIVLILIENMILKKDSIGSVTDFAKDVGKSRQAVLNDKKYAAEILASPGLEGCLSPEGPDRDKEGCPKNRAFSSPRRTLFFIRSQ